MDDPDGESAVKVPVSCSRPSRDAQAEETQWLVETRIAMNPLFLFDVLPADDRKPGKQDHLWQQISERFRQRFPALVPKTPLQLRAKWQKLLKRYRKDCRAVVSKVMDYSFMAHFRLIDTYFRNQADADYQRLMATVPDIDPSPGPAGEETEESVGMPDSSSVTVIVACETCVVPLCTNTADNTDPRLVRFIRLHERMPPRKAAFQQLQLPYVGKTHELYICTEHFAAEDVDITAVLPVRAQAMPTRNLPENSLNSLKKLPIEGNTALIDQRMQKYANGQWKILSLYRRGAAVCDGGNAENEKSEIKSKSPAWLHFRPAYPAGNVCNYCSKLFLANTTSTLLNHLRRFHAEHLAPEVNRELPVKRRRAVERGEDGDAGPYHSFQSELKLVEFITEINPFQHTEQIDYCAAWTKVLQAYNDAKVDERPLNYRPCRERLQKLLQASQLQALAFRPLFHRAAPADLQHLDTLLHTIQAAFDAYERARRDKPHWTLKTYPRRPKGSGLYQEPPAPPADPSVRVPRIRTNKPHVVKKHRQTCIIRGCTARMVDQKRLGVTLHRCLKKPADEDSPEKKAVYDKWVKAIGLENARAWDERNMICSRHFNEDMLEKLGGVGWKLKKGAYPVRMLRAGEFTAEKAALEKSGSGQQTSGTKGAKKSKTSKGAKKSATTKKPATATFQREEFLTCSFNEIVPDSPRKSRWKKRQQSSQEEPSAPVPVAADSDKKAAETQEPVIKRKKRTGKVPDILPTNCLPDDDPDGLPQPARYDLWDELSSHNYTAPDVGWQLLKGTTKSVVFSRQQLTLAGDWTTQTVTVHADLTVSVCTDATTLVPSDSFTECLDPEGRLGSRVALDRLLNHECFRVIQPPSPSHADAEMLGEVTVSAPLPVLEEDGVDDGPEFGMLPV